MEALLSIKGTIFGVMFTNCSLDESLEGLREINRFIIDGRYRSRAGVIVASTAAVSSYIPSMAVTRLVGPFAPGFPNPMSMAFIGVFSTYDITPPPAFVGLTAYFQAGILAGSNSYVSNGVAGTVAP